MPAKKKKIVVDLRRFRHKPREVYWLTGQTSEDNFALRREFESIANAHNNLIEEVTAMLQAESSSGIAIQTYRAAPSASGGGNASTSKGDTGGSTGDTGETPTDELVALYEGDTAGYLEQKLKAGNNVYIERVMTPDGMAMLIGLNSDLAQYSFAFTPATEVTIYHPFNNNLYSFTLDKPLPDGSVGPLTYETYKKWPNRLWLRFADDEYGIATLAGHLGTVQVG